MPRKSVNLLCRLTCSKKSEEVVGPDYKSKFSSTTKELPVSTGAKLLGINRTSVYYGGLPVSQKELEGKAISDHLHTDNPIWGARQMSVQLKLRGYQVGRRNAGRYMHICVKWTLSKKKMCTICNLLVLLQQN